MGANVLVLEDVDALRIEVSETLEDEGYHVSSAGKPEEAIDLARWNEFDLFLTDVRMAGATDGIGALEAVKKIRPTIYSIIMTGYTDDEAPARAMRQGVDYYLYKPFGMQRLLSAVQQVLETQREHSTYQHQLSQFFKSAQRFLKGKDQEPLELEKERIHFFKAFFAGMQSKNLMMTACLDVWDQLTVLEQHYEGLQQILGEQAEQLAKQYRALRQKAEEYAQSRFPGTMKPRQPDQMPAPQFSKLYNRVADGQLRLPALVTAPILWHTCQRTGRSQPPEQLLPLWRQIFGA